MHTILGHLDIDFWPHFSFFRVWSISHILCSDSAIPDSLTVELTL